MFFSFIIDIISKLFGLFGYISNDRLYPEPLSKTEEEPYLPIHPVSLRKTWQYDDTAYNFVLDYMYSLTPFNFEEKILRKLNFSRKIIGSLYTEEELRELLNRVSSDSVKRRFENNSLKKSYDRRIQSWKK